MRPLDGVLTYVFNTLWQTTLLCGAGLAVSRSLRRLGPSVQYKVLVGTLLAATLLPVAGAWSHVGGAQGHALLKLSLDASSALPARRHAGDRTIVLPAILAVGLLGVYGFTFLAALFRLSVGLLRTYAVVRRSLPVALYGDAGEVWARCQQVFAVDRAMIRSVPGLASPVVCGWGRGLLLVPAGFLDLCSGGEMTAALGHEAAHLERRDFLWNGLLELVSVSVAYHPVIWLIKAEIAHSREMICDRMAADRLLGADRYAASLLQLAGRIAVRQQAATIHAIGIFDANVLEKRIMTLTGNSEKLGLVHKMTRLAVAILISTSALATAFAMRPAVEQGADASANMMAAHEEVLAVGHGVTAPALTHSVDPEYPKVAGKPEAFDGSVVLKLVVSKEGSPEAVTIAKGLRPAFDRKAVDAVKQYRFRPAMRNGKPVAVGIQIEVHFQRY